MFSFGCNNLVSVDSIYFSRMNHCRYVLSVGDLRHNTPRSEYERAVTPRLFNAFMRLALNNFSGAKKESLGRTHIAEQAEVRPQHSSRSLEIDFFIHAQGIESDLGHNVEPIGDVAANVEDYFDARAFEKLHEAHRRLQTPFFPVVFSI